MRLVATLGRPATLRRPPATLRRASASGDVVRRRRGGATGSRGTAAGFPEQEFPILCRGAAAAFGAVCGSRRWRLAPLVAGAHRRNWPWTLFWWLLRCAELADAASAAHGGDACGLCLARARTSATPVARCTLVRQKSTCLR